MDSDPIEYTEEYLLRMIRDGVKENVTLDYKRCASITKEDPSKQELSKDVSAFANSAGGSIIYGIIEDQKTKLPMELDCGFKPSEISREMIEDIITSNIRPKIDGIRIIQIDLKTSHPGKVAYAITIPSSVRGPHQAANLKYYKRNNFKSEPMEDYEINDVRNRRTSNPAL